MASSRLLVRRSCSVLEPNIRKGCHHSMANFNHTLNGSKPLLNHCVRSMHTLQRRQTSLFQNFAKFPQPYIHLRQCHKRNLTIFGFRVTHRWVARYFLPRFVLVVWGGGFVMAGMYLLKKSIDTEGFTMNFSPGEGGDVGKDDWTMIDHDGKLVKKEDFIGRYTLIYFGFTFCPDVCPIEMKKLADIADILQERGLLQKVVPIFVSVDYRRDTPKMIKNYCLQYSDKILGLGGNRTQMEHFARVMRTYFSKPPELEEDYILEHSTYMYFTGTDGAFKHLTNTEDSPEVLANKVCMWIAQDRGRFATLVERTKQLFR